MHGLSLGVISAVETTRSEPDARMHTAYVVWCGCMLAFCFHLFRPDRGCSLAFARSHRARAGLSSDDLCHDSRDYYLTHNLINQETPAATE